MRDEFAGNLSGGQRKLLEMARALMADPQLIMLDEPMAGVNPALKQSLLDHVKSLRDEGRTVHLRRARHGHGARHQRLGGGHGRGRRSSPRARPSPIGANQQVIDAYLGAHHDMDLGGSAMAENVIVATELVAGYVPEVNILNGCNLTLANGEFVGIIGPNGAGKSTLLKAVLGLVHVRSGTVTLDGDDITGRKPYELVARGRGLRAPDPQRVPEPDRAGEPGDGLLPAARRSSTTASSTSPRCSPACGSGPSSAPARCRVASGRWWPWVGR